MVKHTQTIHHQIADELFDCVSPFCGVGTLKKSDNRYPKRNFKTHKLNMTSSIQQDLNRLRIDIRYPSPQNY